MSSEPTKLTPWQKLHAMSYRFYQRAEWTPKKGDYYTTSRADLELYRIVDIVDDKVYTKYCDPEKHASNAEWDITDFTAPYSFGYARVYVPDFILKSIKD